MSLIKCDSCRKLVDDGAKSCPHCGNPDVVKMPAGCGNVVAVILVLFSGLLAFSSGHPVIVMVFIVFVAVMIYSFSQTLR